MAANVGGSIVLALAGMLALVSFIFKGKVCSAFFNCVFAVQLCRLMTLMKVQLPIGIWYFSNKALQPFSFTHFLIGDLVNQLFALIGITLNTVTLDDQYGVSNLFMMHRLIQYAIVFVPLYLFFLLVHLIALALKVWLFKNKYMLNFYFNTRGMLCFNFFI
jgi:hypothetical protein